MEYIYAVTGNKTVPTATVRLQKKDGGLSEGAASGDGPVDAAYKAIDKITKIPVKVISYELRAVTGGRKALGEVVVQVKYKTKQVIGRGVSTDVIEASAKAYLNAINKVVSIK